MIGQIAQLLLGIAYPILIFFSLAWLEPREVAAVLLGLAVLRLITARPGAAFAFAQEVWIPVAAVAAIAIGTAIWNDPIGLLLAPTLINAALLATFGLSLGSDRPIVERFARLQVEDLTEAEVRYCRRVTQVWCVFFVLNGSMALYLALGASIQSWALFTGLISYILIGTLFGVEYVYRHWRFRRFLGGIADPLLRRLFPPRPEAPVTRPADRAGA